MHSNKRVCERSKGKRRPRTGHEDPEGEYRYSSTLSFISALDGVGGQATSRPLYLRETYPVPTVQEAEWAPGPVWTGAENLALRRDSIPGPSSP